jgi:hypothetical protein
MFINGYGFDVIDFTEFEVKKTGHKKSELPRLKCFHNGIILIVICFHLQI